MGNSTLFEIDQIVPDQVVYLENMRKNGTYGDHVTLQAAAELFNVQMIVLSSKGNLYNRFIARGGSEQFDQNLTTILLGHFAEDDGAHYVCLSPVGNSTVMDLFTSKIMSSRQVNHDFSTRTTTGLITIP